MLGIPTRSEVKDPVYQRAVLGNKIERSLSQHFWPNFNKFIYNYVTSVIKEAGEQGVSGNGTLHGNPVIDASKSAKPFRSGFRRLLNPNFVFGKYFDYINSARDVLSHAESIGLRGTGIISMQESHPNSSTYYDSSLEKRVSRIRRRTLNLDLVRVGNCTANFTDDPEAKPTEGFSFEYVPLTLARFELDAYEAALTEALGSSSDNFSSFVAMGEVIASFNDNANRELTSSSILSVRPKSLYSFEQKPNNPAYDLVLKNKEIAAGSDVFLKFDESSVIIKMVNDMEVPISAEVLLDEENSFTARMLDFRQSLRDGISRVIEQKGRFVFNGVDCSPVYSSDGISSFESNGAIPKSLVNVVGVPFQNETTILPDSWAVEEVSMVNAYRSGNSSLASSFFDRYSGFNNGDFPVSEESKLKHLEHVLLQK